jgi:hypothetical protein
VKRHTAQHEAKAVRNSAAAHLDPPHPGRRVAQACKACAASKLKCSDGKPCSRCVRKGVTCETDDAVSHTNSSNGLDALTSEVRVPNEGSSTGDDSITVCPPGLLGNEPGTRADSPGSTIISLSLQPEPSGTLAEQDQQAYTSAALELPLDDTSSATGTATIGSRYDVERTMGFGLENHTMPQLHEPEHEMAARNYCEMLRDILGSSTASPAAAEDLLMEDVGEDIWGQFLDAGQSFADLTGFSFVDLAPSDANNAFNMTIGTARQKNVASFEHAATAATTQAFHVSGWNWGPSPDDNEATETTNLILPPGDPRLQSLHPQPTTLNTCLLKQEDRNRLLSMLLKHCEKDQWVRIASTFPSERFLSHLLQFFYTLQDRDTVSWFHRPTVHIESLRVECIAAAIATAACLSLNRSVQRFGYVLPELVRFAVVDQVGPPTPNISSWVSIAGKEKLLTTSKWCRDNSTSRDLQLMNSMCECIVHRLGFTSILSINFNHPNE